MLSGFDILHDVRDYSKCALSRQSQKAANKFEDFREKIKMLTIFKLFIN